MHGKARGSVELDCNFPSVNPADAPASLHVLEWVREGFDVPVLIKFGPHEPRVHPKFEGKLSSTLSQHTIHQENLKSTVKRNVFKNLNTSVHFHQVIPRKLMRVHAVL